MDTSLTPLLTAQDVALWLGFSSAKVERMARRKQIPCVAIPGDEVRFDANDLRKWLDELNAPKGGAK